MSDNISRQKLIEEIVYTTRHDILYSSYDCYEGNEVLAIIDEIIELIKSQPLVSQWIPCSERLPEESNRYEITIEHDSKQLTGTAYYSTKEGRWGTYTNYVTAWRERLSEPYKEK